ncbi:MAG: hypothetical protein RLZZ488_2066 [Pseudomonadota bacterium]
MTPRILPYVLIGLCTFTASCGQWEKKEPTEKTDLISEPPLEDNNVPPEVTPTPNAQAHDGITQVQPQQEVPDDVGTDDTEPPVAPQEPEGIIIAESENVRTLEDWINHPENGATLKSFGTFDSNKRTLTLHQSATLSFSRFTVHGKLLIETRGLNLTLVGSDFTDLEIKTTNAQGHSGHVRIYSTSKTLPKIDASGRGGINGEDGRCPNGQKCVLLSDRLTKTTLSEIYPITTTKEHSKTFDWNDTQVPEEWRQRTRESIQQEDLNSAGRFCEPHHPILFFNGIQVAGSLVFTQRLMHFSLPTQTTFPEPVHAQLYEAQTGSDGSNGGNVSIVQLGKINDGEMSKINTSGGTEGKGGLNVKRAPSEARAQKIYSTIKITETLNFDGLKISWKLYCFSSPRGPIGNGGWMHAPAQFLARGTYVPTNDFYEHHSVSVPAIPAGEDLPESLSLAAASGRSGMNGKLEIKNLSKAQQLRAAIHPSIPLPKEFNNY